jgi:hypothetical protein
MRLPRRYLPSPALVVACLALLVALGGTGYAAIKLPANSVGTKQLKRGAVTGVKVKSNTLTGTQINESRLGRVPSAATAATATTATSATSATSAPVSRLDYASAVVAIPAGFAPPTRGTVNCPTGLNATGGGAKMTDPAQGFIIDTNPVGKTGWEATAQSATAQNATVFVSAPRPRRPRHNDLILGSPPAPAGGLYFQRSQRTTSPRDLRRWEKTLAPLLGSSASAA